MPVPPPVLPPGSSVKMSTTDGLTRSTRADVERVAGTGVIVGVAVEVGGIGVNVGVAVGTGVEVGGFAVGVVVEVGWGVGVAVAVAEGMGVGVGDGVAEGAA